eukprot:SAG25_NODE_11528_length_302_cov_0.748768_1_plen_20_part_01
MEPKYLKGHLKKHLFKGLLA